MNDSHFKVQCKAQSLLEEFFKYYSLLKVHSSKSKLLKDKTFEELLLKILNNLTDKRKEVNEGAMQLIELIRKVMSIDYLCIRTLSIFEVKTTRTKIACFELMASVIKDSESFTTTCIYVKKLIKKCLFHLNQNSKDTNFIGPILSIILCLRDMNFSETMKTLTGSSVNYIEYETFEDLCGKFAPDLLINIAEFKKMHISKLPKAATVDKYSKSIDFVKKHAASRSRLSSPDKTYQSIKFNDITNYLSDGYCNVYLKNRVDKLKKIAMNYTIPNSPVVIDLENHSTNTRNLKQNNKDLFSVSKTNDLNLESTSNKPYALSSGKFSLINSNLILKNIVPSSGVRTMANSRTRVYCKSKTNSTVGLDLDKSESNEIISKYLLKILS